MMYRKSIVHSSIHFKYTFLIKTHKQINCKKQCTKNALKENRIANYLRQLVSLTFNKVIEKKTFGANNIHLYKYYLSFRFCRILLR